MSTPLRELCTALFFDPVEQAAFADDPDRYLRDHGWDDLDGADVEVAFGALVHELPIHQAVVLDAVRPDHADGAIGALRSAAAAFGDPEPSDDPLDPTALTDPAAELDREDATDQIDHDVDPSPDDPADGIDGGADEDDPAGAAGDGGVEVDVAELDAEPVESTAAEPADAAVDVGAPDDVGASDGFDELDGLDGLDGFDGLADLDPVDDEGAPWPERPGPLDEDGAVDDGGPEPFDG
jgi:hypothetical protein